LQSGFATGSTTWDLTSGSDSLTNSGHTLFFSGFTSLIGDDNGDTFNLNSGSFTTITGGSSSDTFNINGGSVTTLDGGSGAADSLNVTGLGVLTATINNVSANGYQGTESTGTVGTFKNMDSLTAAAGSTLTDSLASGATTWTLGATDTLKNAANGTFTFAGFSTLNGDNNGDSFTLNSGTFTAISGGTGADSFTINGGSVTTLNGGTGAAIDT